MNVVSDVVEWFLIGPNIIQVVERGVFKDVMDFHEKCEHLVVRRHRSVVRTSRSHQNVPMETFRLRRYGVNVRHICCARLSYN